MKNFIKFFLFMSVFLSNNTQDVKNNEYVHNEQSWGQVTKKYQNSVLQLFTWSHDYSWAEPFKAPEVSGSCASCFFINDDGLLLTNYHCVKNAVVMYVQMPLFGKKRFKVEIVAVCPDRDLALLKLTPQSYEEIVSVLGQLLVLEIDDQNTVNRGDDIMLMGYPLGQESLKSTTGVVSGLQYVYNRGIRFQLTAPTNPGNSGGPALNKEGKSQLDTPMREGDLMSAEECASNIVKGIQKRKRTLVMTFTGKRTVFMNKFFPSLTDKLVRRFFFKNGELV